jgi:hypothetical protein
VKPARKLSQILGWFLLCLLPSCATAPTAPIGDRPGFVREWDVRPDDSKAAGHWEDAGDPSDYKKVGLEPGMQHSTRTRLLRALIYYPTRLCTAPDGLWV